MKPLRIIGILLLGALSLFDALGQQPPLTFEQPLARQNLQSFRGVPISSTNNNPVGSDGRGPATPGTLQQFQSLLSLGGVVTNTTGGTNTKGDPLLIAHRSRVGNPFVGNSFSYLFGQVIPPPSTDEYGVSLDQTNPTTARPPTLPSSYWVAEPYSTDNHAGAAYYWSPHAEAVYAARPGFVSVSWRRAQAGAPVGQPPDVTTVMEDGRPYAVYTKQEVVSPFPAKAPRRIYWTEGPFSQVGRPINIPTDRIKGVKVIYNDEVPEFTELREVVTTNTTTVAGMEPVSIVQTNLVRWEYPFDGTQAGSSTITNTFWYNRTLNSLRAYNKEGRVFIEFLGDKRGVSNGQDVFQQLGYEIVEVVQRPTAVDVTTELGERLTPYQGESPEDAPELFADPILNLGQEFAYRHSVAGTAEFDYYAIRETRNQDDYQMHWMEEGLQGLRWPYRYVRYKMVWPDDVAKYSHYVRPRVNTELEAKATAVVLPSQNAPQIIYQDPLDQPRGKLTESFAYYSWLTPQYPAHRALLRFNAGQYVRFERIFSWLDEGLRDNQPPPLASLPRFETDFVDDSLDGAVYGASIYGGPAAQILGGRLRLTTQTANRSGGFVLKDFPAPGEVVDSFKATFSLRLRSDGVPGEGLSFNFGTLPNGTLPLAEEGTDDGLVVSFDLADNGANDYGPGIEIKLDGVHVAAVSMGGDYATNPGMLPQPIDPTTGLPMVLMNGTALVPVEIELTVGGLMNVSFRGVNVLQNVPTGYKPRWGQFGFFARTSDLMAVQEIDNLNITINLPPPVLRSFTTDFASVPGSALVGGATPLGDARVADGFLHLTEAQNSQNGGFLIHDLTDNGRETVGSFTATFNVSLRDSTCCGERTADGFSFNFGNISDRNLHVGENGINKGLVVSFDLWDNGPNDYAPGIEIKLDGRHIAAVKMADPSFESPNPGMLPALTQAIGSGVRGVTREVFTEINGESVFNLTRDPRFPSSPTYATREPNFEAPSNISDSYGQRLRALLTVPTTGDYRFAIASDDGSELWLSTNADPALRVLKALQPGVTAPREYLQDPIQMSEPIVLQAGQSIYIEALMQEYGGGDHLSVAWQMPGGPAITNGTPPISGNYLTPYSGPMTLTTGPEFVPVAIELRAGGLMDVSYKGVKVLQNIPTGYTPRGGIFGLFARTGGANSTHWIDDLSISYAGPAYVPAAAYANSVASDLSSWLPGAKGFIWPDVSVRPRVVESTAFVGQRITAPNGEIGHGLGAEYLAGYIQTSQGDSYHPDAYLDPFISGFEVANQGSIIPVNAIPDKNLLEVWWFRNGQMKEADVARGFQNAFWPSVIGRYSTSWPTDADEIILASNDGSGGLPSLQAKGKIYVQNNAAQPGYNPNEEHALMQGGQAWALRDDLNITAPGPTYSSDPFVLLEYTEEDGKLAIRPFHVRREQPEAGITFEYQKPAAQILQAPMPLPLLGVAFAPKLPGVPRKGLNEELIAWTVADSATDPDNNALWTLRTDTTHGLLPFWTLALEDVRQSPTDRRWFYAATTTEDTVQGVISTHRPFVLGALDPSVPQSTPSNLWRFGTTQADQIPLGPALLALPPDEKGWMVTVTDRAAVGGYVEIEFVDSPPSEATTATEAVLVPALSGLADGTFDEWRLAWNELPQTVSDPERQKLYASATVQDRKGNVWVYRGPHREDRPESFNMRFYYNTLPGFYFPSLTANAQPPVGTVTPYLRKKAKNGTFVGDAVYGNKDGNQENDKNALLITYHPYWPDDAPVLQMAETLTTPKRGLPAVRGQSSLEVLYQQSQIEINADRLNINKDRTSVLLHDPTRQKKVEYDQDKLPASINTELSRGKIWFPNLPPHLVKRFWLDPNEGENGMLVFSGEFVDAPLGDKYVLLNVAGTNDVGYLKELSPEHLKDPKKDLWDQAIDALATDMETFVENPAVPGTYIPFAPLTQTIPIDAVAEVTDDDVAVDSYALTAIGPETGYVTLIAGNGLAFTPEGEPVSMEVIRVVPDLYRGEVNVIESENPLNESLTLQQVVDLAGHAEDYTFEWRIAAPVDGQPVDTYQQVGWRANLAPWSHLPFPVATDKASNVENSAPNRVSQDISQWVIPVSDLPFQSVIKQGDFFAFTFPESSPHHLAKGNRLVMSSADDVQVLVTVRNLPAANQVVVSVDPNQLTRLDASEIFRLSERVLEDQPQSIAFTSFAVDATETPRLTEVWVSLNMATGLMAKVYLNGGLVVTTGSSDPDANTIPRNPPVQLTPARPDLYFRLPSSVLAGSSAGPNGWRTNRLAVELFAPALPGTNLAFQVHVEAINSEDQVVNGSDWIPLDRTQYPDGVRAIVGQNADVRSLSDNYLTMRYRPNADPNGWSQWTEPQLAEGWIKRVLKGINPFNQRVTDLYNNAVNTDVSILAQAGARWEGNIALNLDSINNYGLIEIYETVLNRGKDLSINADINYGPANDALLLAAGYINDLYMLVGNDAAADAANPTIGIGTADNTYGDIATALFAFKGQLPSLLAEELALLRGRDDFLVPGVETRPVYNRLVWNYTRGIDAGEVIYALNYNILDQNTDGKADALDALKLYPQGHGDAYGHYLTALTGYYHLLLDPNFDWVPRSEAVLVLGKPVSVDYQDERKFAAAAGALARTGKQIFDLTRRKDYRSGPGQGWEHFRPDGPGETSNQGRTRRWGLDHWASRTAQGAYLNWIAGNSILPYQDPDPKHADTIQQVDRTTVPELKELPSVMESLQTAMDNAESGLTPLGLPEDTVPFDLNPNGVVDGQGETHFEQIYTRAKQALNNAVVAFDDAKDVTRLMRSEEDSLADLRAAVDKQELAYTNALIELFGTPYPEDIGPGKTYRTGFAGPDTIHYMYVDNVELEFRNQLGGSLLVPSEDYEFSIDTQSFTADWMDPNGISDFSFIQPARNGIVDGTDPLEAWVTNTTLHVDFTLSSHGFFKKPKTWVGRRSSPGKIQQAISDIIKARNAAFTAFYWADAAKYDLDWAIQSLDRKIASHNYIRGIESVLVDLDVTTGAAKLAWELADDAFQSSVGDVAEAAEALEKALPRVTGAGTTVITDPGAPAVAASKASAILSKKAILSLRYAALATQKALEYSTETTKQLEEFNKIAPEEWAQELRDSMDDLRDKAYGMNNEFMTINARLQELDDAQRNYRALLAEGDRIQAEREILRNRTAAIIQGYRTRDAAFRIFRNEKLERYKSLFDLAAQYAFLAAKAYDYETGLLGTDRGREFINRIVNSRALGVVKNGEPQFAGSNNGDPGLSSVLAEMHADWSVVKSRLGFNNPDAYGTTASLSYENYRIITNTVRWTDVMSRARKANLLDDPDVRRYCLQIDDGTGSPVPGLVFEFGTTIANGQNLFGRPLAPGDHKFTASSFATKIFAAGVALEGYVGMDDPAINSGAVSGSGSTSPSDPSLVFLDPNALSANPFIYLIPVGVDSMRSPPLGDTSDIRNWNVNDVAIPLPFNIGGSDYSSVRLWQSQDSLTEAPFTLRKHQAFRPVSSASVFDPDIYTTTGGLQRSQFTSNRLIGRSVWNSKWKIVIPGRELLADPNEGIERFLRTVKDVKLHFVTYSYSGN